MCCYNKIELAELFTLYQKLLTNKQLQIAEMYYYEDLSLSEIADVLKISRAAIQQTIKKVESILIKLEQAINFKSIKDQVLKIANQEENATNKQIIKILTGG